MSMNQLEYFISAAETLNFTKAARKCFISQTAMTQQIKALEAKVGVPLFVRDKHHVELTTAGKVYLNEARGILARNNEALRLARLASTGIYGSLRIGFIRGYGASDLSQILRRFHHSYPNISFSLYRDNSSILYQKLEQGDCDLIFTLSSRHTTHMDMDHFYIKSFPLMCALSPDHPLSVKQFVTYPDLKDENYIMMQPPGRSKDEMEESLLVYERGGFFPNIIALESDPETLLLMVSVGMGISILPEYITHIHQKRDDLSLLPVLKADGTAETLDLEIIWPKNNPNPAVDQMLEILRS